MIIDYSSVQKSVDPVAQFPTGYRHPFVDPNTLMADERWEGVFMENIAVTLPDKFHPEDRTGFGVGAKHLIADQTGLSAEMYATGLVGLGDRKVNQWAFTVDTFSVRLLHNTFEEARLDGLINVPLLGAKANCGAPVPENAPLIREDCLSYTGTIRPGAFSLGLRLNRDYCIPVLKTNLLVIAENSSVQLDYAQGELTAEATLHGSISIDMQAAGGEVAFTMDNLGFRNLTVRTTPPYLSPGIWSAPTGASAKLFAFDIGFEGIRMAEDSLQSNDGRNCQLYFEAFTSFDSEFDVDARGVFRMLGTLEDTPNGQRYRYSNFKVDGFRLKASTSSFYIDARFAFYGQDTPDPEWGSGFYGGGTLVVSAFPQGDVGVGAIAQFGSKDGTIYFMIDVAAITAGLHIPVLPGLELGAIGGGFYFNMGAAETFNDMVDGDAELASRMTKVDNERAARTPERSRFNGILGRGLSNKPYEFRPRSFGLFAQVVLVAPNPEAYSITGRLELAINLSHGAQFSLQASAQAFATPNYTGNLYIDEGVGIFAEIAVGYNNELGFFYRALAEVYINIGEGDARIQGINSVSTNAPARSEFVGGDGYAGGLDLQMTTRQGWHFLLGTPDERLGLKIPATSSSASAYLCVGNNIPPIPDVPPDIAAIVGDVNLRRDLGALESASGFAFGADVRLAGSGRALSIFEYNFWAQIGFDISIRNYGDAVCADDPTGPTVGVNGWYAAGQVYAGIGGSLSVAGFNVAEAGIAAVLQLTGPRPTMARGVVAGYYRVFGGKRRDFRFEAKFGDTCPIVGRGGDHAYASLDVIVRTTVADGEEGVATSVIPGATLAAPIRSAVEFGDDRYWVSVTKNELWKVGDDSRPVARHAIGTAGASEIMANVGDYLEPNTTYRYELELSVTKNNQRIDARGTDTTIIFTTGDVDYTFDLANLDYSYPEQGMVNTYYEEYEGGKIVTNRAMTGVDDDLYVVFTSADGWRRDVPVTRFNKEFRFDFPSGLSANTIYRLDFVRRTAIVTNGGGGGTNPPNFPDGGQLPVQSPVDLPGGGDAFHASLPNYRLTTQDDLLHSLFFRTSQYATFSEKVDANVARLRVGSNGFHVADLDGLENWSEEELRRAEDDSNQRDWLEVSVDNSTSYPSRDLRDRYLPYQRLQLQGYNMAGDISANCSNVDGAFYGMCTVDLSDVELYYPQGKYAISYDYENAPYFDAVDTVRFESGQYEVRTTGQQLLFPMPALVGDNLLRLRSQVETINGIQFEILLAATGGADASSNYGTQYPTPPGRHSLHCTQSGTVNMRHGFSQMDQLRDALRGQWTTDIDPNKCPLPTQVIEAAKYNNGLDNPGYQGKTVRLRFTYRPKGMDARFLRKDVRL